MNTYFNYEIYTYNNDMTISGWDIKTISVKADTKAEANEKIKNYPLFDCCILYNFMSKENETAQFLETECYPHYKVINRI
jgi:hypothetical protein